MAGKTIHAAGGIVVRNGARPLIAVVQRSKDELWVLPRGKLKRKESPLAGAHREVVEETGHKVRVREFLGVLSYRARGRPKVVQFWRMAVEWLPLSAAVRRLSYPLEKLFLRNVGRTALRQRRRHRRKTRHATKTKVRRHAAKTNGSKSRSRRITASHGRAGKVAGHSAARGRQANILRRVLGRLTP
jgi:8-oxo-dGTP diphosphatase